MGTGTTGISLEAAIAALTKDFAEAGRILDVDRAAFGMSMAYPESCLTTEEIRRCIVDAAQLCGTAMFVEGARPGAASTPVVPAGPTPAPTQQRSARAPASPLRQILLRTAAYAAATRLVPPPQPRPGALTVSRGNIELNGSAKRKTPAPSAVV